MSTQEKFYTVEQFWELAHLPENENRHLELIHGVISEMTPSSPENGIIAAWLIHLLLSFVVPNHLGYVTGPDTGYQLGPTTVRQPDAAFISKQRADRIPNKVFSVGPDLAVEVISPSESASEINDKITLYFGAGTHQVWLVYPTTRTLHLYQAANQVQILQGEQSIDASRALPGLTLKVADIFAVLDN